jgi:hypothetical protein
VFEIIKLSHETVPSTPLIAQTPSPFDGKRSSQVDRGIGIAAITDP